jgi:hypothetical protein
MPDCAVLIKEIQSLPPSSWSEVLDFVEHIKQKNQNMTHTLEQAAEKAAVEYTSDPELTAFCILDGEPFYGAR